jgi:sulfide:quinone oxidoreductase
MSRVLVLGGGFAGVESAVQLRKRGHEVTLVSDRDFAYVAPISIWIPTGELPFDKARLPLAEVARRHGFELVVDAVRGLDVAAREVRLAGQTLRWDALVLAIGAGKAPAPGVEHTHTVCGGPQRTLDLKAALDALLARARAAEQAGTDERFTIAFGFGGNPKDKSAVRGGPVFELLFNVRHLLKRERLLERVRLEFFAPMEKPGIRMGEKAYAAMLRWFERLGIPKRFGTRIERFQPEGVRFVDGTELAADLVVFVPAGAGHPVLKESGLPLTEAGFVSIDDGCRVRGLERVYAVGDVAAIEGPEWAAKQGHLAEVMAQVAANNLDLELGGRGARHTYTEHLNILCVMDSGDGAALVYRDARRQVFLPLPIVGHWLKRLWGWYWKAARLGRAPRVPGF